MNKLKAIISAGLCLALLSSCQELGLGGSEDSSGNMGDSNLMLAAVLIIATQKKDSCSAIPTQSQNIPIVAFTGSATYLTRAQTGLTTWSSGFSTSLIADTRYLGSSSLAHNPRNWITTSDSTCNRNGIPDNLKNDCPLTGGVIGVCDARYFSSGCRAGQIIDTTQVMRISFQEGGDPNAEKQSVFTHETGHCLGLIHSSSTADIMYSDTTGSDTPSSNESNAIQAAYNQSSCCVKPSTYSARFGNASGNPTFQATKPEFYISATMGNPGSFSLPQPPADVPLDSPLLMGREPIDGEFITVRHLLYKDGGYAMQKILPDGSKLWLKQHRAVGRKHLHGK